MILMDTVFVAHSKHDTPILSHMQQLIREAGINPIFYQYDINNVNETAWEQILSAIRQSQALFVILSDNLQSSPHTQNWVGMEVGIACAQKKPVYVFENIRQPVLFPIPYLTDYVLYDLNNPQLRILISSVAQTYNMRPQRTGMIGFGGLGALFFGPAGLIGGAILGAITNKPKQPPYVRLACYHLECKIQFKSYVWMR